MKLNPEIFRAYDIRGIADKDFDEEFAYHLGLAFGSRVPAGKSVSIGYDCRPTSQKYSLALEEGLASTGLNIIRVGMCPTPLLYFSVFFDQVAGGIMVTGSHNPSEYNGFKLCLGQTTIYGEEIQNLRKTIEKKDYRKGKGEIQNRKDSLIDSYILHLHSRFPILVQNKKNPIKVILDSGNGTAGLVAPQLLKSLGFEVLELFCNVDGTFPNHHPDPTVEKNLEDLKAAVIREKADVGIAYDGDADRIGVISDKGEVVWGDTLLALFAKEIYRQKKSVSVIGEVKCSDSLYEVVKNVGGHAIMWKTGHSYIKEKLKIEKADIAGEMSGHIFFKDRYFGYDDAIYASVRLLEILIHQNKKVSALISDFPKYFTTPEIRIPCDDSKKFTVVEKLKNVFSKKYSLISIDGIRIQFGDGWGLVRPSNTQPVLVLRFEAKTKDRLLEIQKEVETALKEVSVL